MVFATSHLKIFYPSFAEHNWIPGAARPIDVSPSSAYKAPMIFLGLPLKGKKWELIYNRAIVYEPLQSLMDLSLRKVANLITKEKLLSIPQDSRFLKIPIHQDLFNTLLEQYQPKERLFWGPSTPTKQAFDDAYNSLDMRSVHVKCPCFNVHDKHA